MQYAIDLIEKRDSYNKIRSSVIKWWQVNYVDEEAERLASEEKKLAEEEAAKQAEEEKKRKEEEDETMRLAQEVAARLAAEAAEDEAAKQAEIAMAYAAYDESSDDSYNATTGSYSGNYGKNAVLDDDEKNTIDSILKEKSDALSSLIESNKI